MTHPWTDRLSEYLDGSLEESERRGLEEHLAGCGECARTLRELRDVVGRARSLPDRAPAVDLWPAIAAEAGLPRRASRARRLTFSVPQLAAASLAMMLLGGGAAWVALGGSPTAAGPRAVVAPTVAATDTTRRAAVSASARFAGARYDQAVTDLTRILEENRGRLDTATVRVLERNLAIIDAAIAQAERALEADPANPYLSGHLAATMKRKLELLRRAAAMTSAAS